MATELVRKVAYGLSDPLIDVSQGPVVAKRDPNPTDRAQIGTEWINTATNNAFFLTSVVDNMATWVPISSAASVITFDTDAGPAATISDVIDIAGGTNISTA